MHGMGLGRGLGFKGIALRIIPEAVCSRRLAHLMPLHPQVQHCHDLSYSSGLCCRCLYCVLSSGDIRSWSNTRKHQHTHRHPGIVSRPFSKAASTTDALSNPPLGQSQWTSCETRGVSCIGHWVWKRLGRGGKTFTTGTGRWGPVASS